MCVFTGPVREVAQTRIFARRTGEGRQALAYAMSVALDQEVAMVLPLPTPAGAPEDAISWIDLSGYPDLFDDLRSCFEPISGGFDDLGAPAPRAFAATLPVEEVGDYEASFVPSRADFARLDPRFQLSSDILDQLAGAQANDWGFAVFKLRAEPRPWYGRLGRSASEPKRFHPMAFTFPTRDSRTFFPTVHVHDGGWHDQARFDHALYWQGEPAAALEPTWNRAYVPVEDLVDVARTRGLLTQGSVRRRLMQGPHPNRDVWVR